MSAPAGCDAAGAAAGREVPDAVWALDGLASAVLEAAVVPADAADADVAALLDAVAAVESDAEQPASGTAAAVAPMAASTQRREG
jgi:hypothetical protein